MCPHADGNESPVTDKDFPKVSRIVACLKQAACISKARRALNEHKTSGEIIVGAS